MQLCRTVALVGWVVEAQIAKTVQPTARFRSAWVSYVGKSRLA